VSTGTDFRFVLAGRIRSERQALCRAWLERLAKLLPVAEAKIFPAQELLDQVPELLGQFADDLESPEYHEVAANSLVHAKARQLGELRYRQRASIHQILREFDILATVLDEFVVTEVVRTEPRPGASECVLILSRLHRAVRILLQGVVDTYTARYTATIEEQHARLESYNRMVSHELRTPIGTLEMGAELLATEEDVSERVRLIDVLRRNAVRTRRILESLDSFRHDALQPEEHANVQPIALDALVGDVVARLESMARDRGVDVRVATGLPALDADVAKLEMVLRNLVANAIKYSDPQKAERFVEIGGGGDDEQVHFHVEDNGLGIPEEQHPRVFQRFARLHADRDDDLGVEGHGLGLAITRECVEAMSGTIEFDSRAGLGTVFRVRLPRRAEDAAG
jgi:signal transduction histidine kinase